MTKKRNTPLIERIGPEVRLGLSLGVALLAFALALALVPAPDSWHSHIVGSWDAGALHLPRPRMGAAVDIRREVDARPRAQPRILSGYVIFPAGRRGARALPSSRSVLSWGRSGGLPFSSRNLHLALTFAALVSSWLLIHTVFAFHYAHRYYARPARRIRRRAAAAFSGRA